MWDIVWISPQGHRSVSVSRHFLLQAPQCPCSVRKRFSRTSPVRWYHTRRHHTLTQYHHCYFCVLTGTPILILSADCRLLHDVPDLHANLAKHYVISVTDSNVRLFSQDQDQDCISRQDQDQDCMTQDQDQTKTFFPVLESKTLVRLYRNYIFPKL